MEYVETRDSLGFVGAHILRRSRRGKRRQRATRHLSAAMKPDPGAAPTSADGDADDEADAFVLHGWLTRYDVRLDLYTLFVPGSGGGATQHTRDEVLKFVSSGDFKFRTGADPAYPPPVEDTGSRFVGVPVRKTVGAANGKTKRRSRQALDGGDGGAERDESEVEGFVEGRVVSFRPFADLYRVQFDDGSVKEVSEGDVVDALLAFVKRTQDAEKKQREKREEQKNQTQRPHHEEPTAAADTNGETVTATATRKRRRSEDLGGDDDDEETEDEEMPTMAEADGVKLEAARHQLHATKAEAVASSEQQQDAHDSSVTAREAGASTETQRPEPPPPSTEPPPEFDYPLVEDDEPMELPPLDDDDDLDMRDVNTALSSMETSSSATMPLPPTSEVVSLVDEDDDVVVVAAVSPSRPVCYVVDAKPHAATLPLEKRSLAFEFLRTELARLLEEEECSKLETALVSDVLANRDIKDRDAVRRFVESGGLVVINCLLNASASDALIRASDRYERVLFLLKLLAMLPTPSEQQVMEAAIGKTIGRFIKSRMTDHQATADAGMPKCIAHLAKWIKHKWIASMKREAKPGGAAVSDAATSKKHLQRPSQGRPCGPRTSGEYAIPRVVSKPISSSTHPRPPPVLPFGASPAADVLGDALSTSSPRWQPQKSSLKPDWMRQKETLTRTRFTINTDPNAERQHYQRDRSRSKQTRDARGQPVPRPIEEAGDRGVYGRSQRLAFGPRWSVCEFFKDTPASAVRRLHAGSGSSYSRGRFGAKPKSILRKTSKYGDDLSF